VSAELLERSTEALRGTTGSTPAELERGLQRLERRPASRHVRVDLPRFFRTLAWTVAAMLLGVGAWANVTGRVRWFEPEPAPPPAASVVPAPQPRKRPARRAPEPEVLREPAPKAVPEVVPEPSLPEPSPAPPSSLAPPRKHRPIALEPAPAVVREDPDALYRSAHEAHFIRGDYAAALAGWDRYLAIAEPGHRWRVEASYNRGIALYRLGHTDDARRALEPFARGDYGSYRRADAQRLVDALTAR
jgi:hypothetical protein